MKRFDKFTTVTHDVGAPSIADLIKELRPLIDNTGVVTKEPWHLVSPDFLIVNEAKQGAFIETLVAAMNMTRRKDQRAIMARVFPMQPITSLAKATQAVKQYQLRSKQMISDEGINRNSGIILADRSYPHNKKHFKRLCLALGETGFEVKCLITPMRIFIDDALKDFA